MYPDKREILAGVAAFLKGPAADGVSDKGVAFKLRLAAGLLEMVERELEGPVELTGGELLEAALHSPVNPALVANLRHSLAAELKVVAPHFDLRTNVEEPA